MRRIRFQISAAVLLAAAGITFAVLVGVRRLEAANTDLSQADLDVIVAQAVASASVTNSGFRTAPTVQKTKMQIAIVARDGKLLRVYSMPDAWVFTGLAGAFRKAGFVEVARRSETRPIMRLELGSKPRASRGRTHR